MIIKPVTVKAILLAAATLPAQIHITGNLNTDLFSDTAGVFIVEGDVTVPKGTVITVGAGSVFLFKNYTGMIVQGKLIVNGTRERPVVFTTVNDARLNTSAEQLPAEFDWNGITVDRTAGPCELRNAEICYSVFGLKSQSAGITVENCTFHNNGQFSFTINDQIVPVKPGQRFTYNPEAGDTAPPTQPAATSQTAASKAAKAATPRDNKQMKKTVGWVCIGTGAACGVVGAVFGSLAIKDRTTMADATTKIEQMLVRTPSNPQFVEATNTRDKAAESLKGHLGPAIGCLIGAAALLTVGIVLEF